MTWTRIDVGDISSWPPEGELVLVKDYNGYAIGLRFMDYNDDDEDMPFAMYDEGNDLDDGTLGWDIAAGETIAAWHPIPYPEPESADRHLEGEEG